jgi:hypothetical protein
MTKRDDHLRIRPGQIRDSSRARGRPKSFVGEVMGAAKKAGHTGKAFGTNADQRAAHSSPRRVHLISVNSPLTMICYDLDEGPALNAVVA